MENQLTCPKCGTIAVPQSKFCANCGNLLLSESTNISVPRQAWIYFVSIFLPPLGLIWTIKYSRSESPQQKRIAFIALFLTVLSIVVTLFITMRLINSINQQVQSQINGYQNLGI